MKRHERGAILARFAEMRRAGAPIIGGGAGTGISAKAAGRARPSSGGVPGPAFPRRPPRREESTS